MILLLITVLYSQLYYNSRIDFVSYLIFFIILSFFTFYLLFFFFSSRRRHTRSLRDWSSDVCSSDLEGQAIRVEPRGGVRRAGAGGGGCRAREHHLGVQPESPGLRLDRRRARSDGARSEERRVGKECRSRRTSNQEKRKKETPVSDEV